MRLKRLLGHRLNPPAARRRLALEQLDDRTLPSTYTAASVSDLIADINAANKHSGSDTIMLAANTPFVLTAVDNTTAGATGLPVVTKGGLTILGNGATIERSPASGTPAFRLLAVANGSSLTLVNLTLRHGAAIGSGAAAEGGAIYNQGNLVLNGVTVMGNVAGGSNADVGGPGKNGRNGRDGGDAAGGGIWSSGLLTLENGTTIQSNAAIGGMGGTAGGSLDLRPGVGGNGGNGLGGGVYVAGGTVNLTSATLSSNTAKGGLGGQGSVYGAAGIGFGGGLDIAGGSVYLDAFTLDNAINNTADVGPNINGPYVLLA